MYYLLLGLGWILGLGIASFTIIPILTILRFGIPMTRSLEKSGKLIKNNKIVRNYSVSMVILTTVYYFLYLLTGLSETAQSGYIVGTVWSLLFGIGKTGNN